MPASGIPFRVQPDTGQHLAMAGTLFVPASDVTMPHATALVCFPGGGMTRQYFDLPGHSFAAAMAGAGYYVVTFDHPGTGDSEAPADGFSLTAGRLASLGAAATRQAASRLRAGSLSAHIPPLPGLTLIGVGHSMGAMLVALQQAAWHPYAALALLGFSTRGLPEVLTPAERAFARNSDRDDDAYIGLARQRFGGAALAELPPRRDGSAALRAAAAPLLAVAAMQSMLPNNIAAEAARIDVPLFLAVGDRDITGRPKEIAPRFPAAPSARLLVLENTGHHPFIAPSASHLFSELASWAQNPGALA